MNGQPVPGKSTSIENINNITVLLGNLVHEWTTSTWQEYQYREY